MIPYISIFAYNERSEAITTLINHTSEMEIHRSLISLKLDFSIYFFY